VLKRVTEFQGAAPQFDDITLLCLKITCNVAVENGASLELSHVAS
jgi:hypothetical protein